jgi:hypothetical protein
MDAYTFNKKVLVTGNGIKPLQKGRDPLCYHYTNPCNSHALSLSMPLAQR